MNIDLTNRHALVCGSTQGIGKAVALALAKMGAHVVLLARNQAALQEVKASLDSSQGQKHRALCADFSSPESLKVQLNKLAKQGVEPVILINNTGGPAGGPIAEADPDAFVKSFQMHVVCNQILTQAVVAGMKKAGYGRIVNIISTSVKVPIPGLGVSNTIRGAVASWAKTMASELAPFGITVNNVLPGFTDTARLASLIAGKAKRLNKTDEEVKNAMIASVPAGRLAKAEEVANAVAFLASPAAGYINGVNMPVDGGRTGCL